MCDSSISAQVFDSDPTMTRTRGLFCADRRNCLESGPHVRSQNRASIDTDNPLLRKGVCDHSVDLLVSDAFLRRIEVSLNPTPTVTHVEVVRVMGLSFCHTEICTVSASVKRETGIAPCLGSLPR